MLRICLCSDNHGDNEVIAKILEDNFACDYYIHAGDSMSDEEGMSPFVSVLGNCDQYGSFPKERILEIGGHRILLIHGNGYAEFSSYFSEYARNKGCDTVFFGHTHRFFDKEIDGVRFINPGSCHYNRDGSLPSYAIITIDDNGFIYCKRIDIE